jgi:hypothetical protein
MFPASHCMSGGKSYDTQLSKICKRRLRFCPRTPAMAIGCTGGSRYPRRRPPSRSAGPTAAWPTACTPTRTPKTPMPPSGFGRSLRRMRFSATRPAAPATTATANRRPAAIFGRPTPDIALGRLTRRVRHAVSDALLDDVDEKRMRAEGGGHEVVDAGVAGRGLGGERWNIAIAMIAGPKK